MNTAFSEPGWRHSFSASLRAEKRTYSTVVNPAESLYTLTTRRSDYLGKFDEVWDRFLFPERCHPTHCCCGAHKASRGAASPTAPPSDRKSVV